MPSNKKPRMTEEAVPVPVPEPVAETTPEPEERPLSAKERLKLKAKKVAKAGPTKKPREVINLEDPRVSEAVDRLMAVVHVKKVIEGHEKSVKTLVMSACRELVLRDWIAEGRKTETKKMMSSNGNSFNMQCRDTLCGARGFRVPKDSTGDPIPIEQHLKSNSVPDALIERLTEEGEFKEETTFTVPIAQLEKENPSLAERLMDLIDCAGTDGVTTGKGKKIRFTAEEMEKIVTQNNDVTVKEGFLERSVQHCLAVAGTDDTEAAATMLLALLSAVPPGWAVGQALCLKPEEAIVRLLHESPPEPKPEEAATPTETQTPDKKFTLRVEGTKITIVRISDSKVVATKQCKDALHTGNTVKKWMRDPATLTAFIAESTS